MNNIPVAGMDVSKRFSNLCVLAPENEVFTRTKIYHDLTSMERALDLLLQAEQQFGMRPVVVMESTSHYHFILFRFFKNAGYEVIVFGYLSIVLAFAGMAIWFVFGRCP